MMWTRVKRAFERALMLRQLDQALARHQAQGLALTGLDLCHPDMIGAPQNRPRRRAVFRPDPPINWMLIGGAIARATGSTGYVSKLKG